MPVSAASILFARYEPADVAGKRDVAIYRDRDATERVARYPWHYASRPHRGRKSIMHNCARYRLEWLAPLA